MKIRELFPTLAVIVGIVSAMPLRAADPLPSWNDGPAKRAIVGFVERATTEGGPDFVGPSDRIAVFDNDGTLWSAQPVYVQAAFAFDRIRAPADEHPEWREKQPFKGVLDGDLRSALAGGERAVAELVVASHSGLTTEEFEAAVRAWIATAKHPRFGRPYTDLVYQPMLEVLAFLRAPPPVTTGLRSTKPPSRSPASRRGEGESESGPLGRGRSSSSLNRGRPASCSSGGGRST